MVVIGMANICPLLFASLLQPNNLHPGRVFQFVAMSGFLAIWYFLKRSNALTLLRLQNYFTIF